MKRGIVLVLAVVLSGCGATAAAVRHPRVPASAVPVTSAPTTTVKPTTTTTKPQPKPHWVTIATIKGNGDASPQAFAITGSEWALDWAFDCANYGSSGNFSVNITEPGGGFTSDIGPNQLAETGHSVDYYYDKGTFQLQVFSECRWIVQVGEMKQ